MIRDGHLIFYRTRGEESEGSIADLVHQTAMYYEDRLSGQRFDGVLLAGGSTAAGADHLRRRVVRAARPRGRLGRSVPGGVADGRAARRPALADLLAPSVGLLVREGTGPSRAARQPGDPAVLQRAAGPRAADHRAGRGGGVGGGQRRQPGQPLAAGRDAGRARAQHRGSPREAARREAEALRATLNAAEIAAASGAATEANQLIAQRTFSWTTLFNRIEATLPPDVRLVQVQPQADDDGQMMVSLTVVSRRIEDLDTFIERLEATGSFRGVLSRSDNALEDGTIESHLQGYYVQAAKPVAAASDPSGAPPAPRGRRGQPMTQTRGAFARRVLADHRAWIWPLGLLVAANLIVLVLAVAADVASRCAAAEVRARLASAEADRRRRRAEGGHGHPRRPRRRHPRAGAVLPRRAAGRRLRRHGGCCSCGWRSSPATTDVAFARSAADARGASATARWPGCGSAPSCRAATTTSASSSTRSRPPTISWSSIRWCWPKATSSRRRST